MEKISYNLVFNRKKRLNKKGMALVQVEAYLTLIPQHYYKIFFLST